MGRIEQRLVGVYLDPETWARVKGIVESDGGASVRSYVGGLLASGMRIVTGSVPSGMPRFPRSGKGSGRMRATPRERSSPARSGKTHVAGRLPAEVVREAKAAAGLLDMTCEDLLMLGLLSDLGKRGMPCPEVGRKAVERLRRLSPGKARALMSRFG